MDCPAEMQKAAPDNAPMIIRSINGPGLVRAAIQDCLSSTSSTRASAEETQTAVVVPRNASLDPPRCSHPRCAAKQTAAGAVKDRIPAIIPMANASPSTAVKLMAVSLTQHLELVETVHVQDQIASRIDAESWYELCSPHKFIVPVDRKSAV